MTKNLELSKSNSKRCSESLNESSCTTPAKKRTLNDDSPSSQSQQGSSSLQTSLNDLTSVVQQGTTSNQGISNAIKCIYC